MANLAIEQQLIEVIGVHIIHQLAQQRSFLEKGDSVTFNYMSTNLNTYLYQSELAYQAVFSFVDGFLERVRTSLNSTPIYFCSDDSLIKHDEFVATIQSILKESLDELSHLINSELEAA